VLAGGKGRALFDTLPLGGRLQHALRWDRLHRLAQLLGSVDANEMLERLTKGGPTAFGNPYSRSSAASPQFSDLISRLIFEDMTGYLPGDILVKLDRATMACSLEGRCPL